MSSPGPGPLPKLSIADFGPGMDHLVETYLNRKVIAIIHKDDPARQILPQLNFDPNDQHTYVFVHGGEEATRFENLRQGTHEIPEQVVAELLTNEYGTQLHGMNLRMCTCYGNLLRPGDARTLVQGLAGLLPTTHFEGYHGLVILEINPPTLKFGRSVIWDVFGPFPGPVIVGPPGTWEPIAP
jgi:hypothetical protein